MSRSLCGLLSGAALALLTTTPVAFSEPVKENIGLFGGYVADILALDDGGTTELLIAVENSQRGVYRYDTSSMTWGSETNPPGTALAASDKTPGYASQLEGYPGNPELAFATLSNDRTGMNRRLYGHADYGRAVTGTLVWEEINDPASGATYDDVVIMHGHSTGMYFAQRDKISVITHSSGSLSISSIFEMSDITSLSSAMDWEVVDFALTDVSKAYVAIRNGMTDAYRLYEISPAGAPTRITLPAAAPVELRTGTCPLSDCDVKVELVTADLADSTGDTLYIAGSSVNAMIFKSTDGGSTWDQGADFQCINNTACGGGEFYDGYPRGDVARYKGTATSGSESRYVFIGRVVYDNDTPGSGWQTTAKLSTTVMSSGSPVIVESNANDPAVELDPNDSTKVYIATDLAIGAMTHTTGYLSSGSEIAAAQGIEGLIINDLDYFEISPTEKHLWIATKSGAAFAPNYDPTNPTSVSAASSWVFPIFAGGDGAPHRAVIIDPNDKANVLMGIGAVYRNETGDGIDPSTGVYDPVLVADNSNWSRVFDPENFATDPSVDPTTTDPLFGDNVMRSYATALEWQTSSAGSCDRAYLSIANTDEGEQGGVFYSDDDGGTWSADTLSSGRFSAPVNTLLSNDNFLWAGVGDEFGRSSLSGIYARVSLCASNDWWKPTHTDPIFTAIQADDYVVAVDGATTPSEASITARAYIGSNEIESTPPTSSPTYRVTKAELQNSTSCSGFACWQFTDVTPSSIYGPVSAVAVDPSDTTHVWVSYSNCIQESTDGGSTWSDFGGACTDDHEDVVALVYDDLIAGTSQGAYAYASEPSEETDSDADGVSDEEDAFPDDPAASVDTDEDGMPDEWNAGATEIQISASSLTLDDDDDNDGFTDVEEADAGTDPQSANSTPLPSGLSIALIAAVLNTSEEASSPASFDFTADFESQDPSADAPISGWSVYVNVFTGDTYAYGYGFGAKVNDEQALNISDEVGTGQGAQSLNVYSDYSNREAQESGQRVEVNVYREFTIDAADTGDIRLEFDAKRPSDTSLGISAPGSAAGFIKILDPNNNYQTVFYETVDTTNISSTTWSRLAVDVTLDGETQAGLLIQFGFTVSSTNDAASGVLYDNVTVFRQ